MATVIQLEDVQKTYQAEAVSVRAVRGVSLKIERGDFVAVMGPSGSGKSTLMNILGCLDRPTQGRYLLDGTEVSALNADERAALRNRKLGFVFQSFNLLSRTTALENIELPMLCSHRRVKARDLRARAERCLQRVGLADRMTHFPNQLSGGQQQRVALARALINEPEVILADEPTGNLDTRTSAEVMGLLQDLNDEGITVVMVTHELEIARFAKRTLVMRDGRLIRDEPVAARLFAAPELERLEAEEKAAQLSGDEP